MKRYLLLLAAVVGLLITACSKESEYATSILGTWKGYSRSHTLLKNGKTVSAETLVRDMIKIGKMEEPADAEEMAEAIEEAGYIISDGYLLEGDEDITLTFNRGGTATSVYVDEEPHTSNLTYSIKGKRLIISDADDPSNTMIVTIERITDKEFAFSSETEDIRPYYSEDLKALGYSVRSYMVFMRVSR